MNFPRHAELPQSGAHIFYHRRAADVRDPLPKISGHWHSELCATKLVLARMLGAQAAQTQPDR